MKEFIFLSLLLGATLLFIIFYIKNRKKLKHFEHSLPNDVVKTRFSVNHRFLYVDKNNCTTIILNVVPWKIDYVKDFVFERFLKIGKSAFLFDLSRRKCALLQDVVKQKWITTRPLEQYKSIELCEISRTKTVTRGGISPIAIHGYRVASVSKCRERTISRIYFVLTYVADGREYKQELDLYKGLLHSTSSAYERHLRKAEDFIKDFSRYTRCRVGSC